VKSLENILQTLNKNTAIKVSHRPRPKTNSSIGKEMSRLDPFYAASVAVERNPFQQPFFPVKLAGPDMFCSCFESAAVGIREEEDEGGKKNPPFRKALSLVDR
jgi:hypothetical protein